MFETLLHFLIGGLIGLVSASLALQFGWRSADRMPGESRWPHCVYCLSPFRWQSLVPLFGWLRRPERFALPCPCGKRKGWWPQPAAEGVGFLLGALGMSLAGWSALALVLCVMLGLVTAIALIDLHFGIMPDGLTALVAALGLVWLMLGGGDLYAGLMVAGGMLLLGLFCAIVYSRWRGQEMLGLGDVKFFAAAGLWLQPSLAPWFLALAGTMGAIGGLVWQRMGGGKESPFAPSLCLALAILVLYQATQLP
ncbi:MAG: A24 family peptidase [Alphaproteobacteria bacterium]|nr:A24 family peptidase [Alphaproteobacteria bacterium]